MIDSKTHQKTVAIIGGGLAGLTAASYLARAGCRVTIYEKSRTIGGRARTQTYGTFHFNQGPHALYARGIGVEVLTELGVTIRGDKPSLNGLAVRHKHLSALPITPGGFLQSDLLSLRGKAELTGFMARLSLIKAEALRTLTLNDWVRETFHQPDVREFILMLARLLTYTNAPEVSSAEIFVSQLKLSIKSNVYYLDHGWQQLVDQLEQIARQAGAEIVTGRRVTSLHPTGETCQLDFADGSTSFATAVVLATSPETASALIEDGQDPLLRQWSHASIPGYAACLDLGLRRLPVPERTFALGIDQPLYFSVHSTYARELAPESQAMVHVLKYLQPSEKATDSKQVELELEEFLDQVQPGWQSEVLRRRYLPRMVVTPSIVLAERGGLAGRPGPAIPRRSNLYVAGDWVGLDGLLADASFASGRQAARMILDVEGRSEQLQRSSGVNKSELVEQRL